ncbi:SWPV1-169 [Shearwaterpox virus]|uniref:SWPV1-169 n=1 Tax=Shearwaterpox virus TaxID=1974596 RepID=A0A1V0S7Z1_CNPV|nr:SWPV1-169 [Shearwaterpox virus]
MLLVLYYLNMRRAKSEDIDIMSFTVNEENDANSIFRMFHIRTEGKYAYDNSLYDYHIVYNVDGVEKKIIFEKNTESQLYKILKSYNYLYIVRITILPVIEKSCKRHRRRKHRH